MLKNIIKKQLIKNHIKKLNKKRETIKDFNKYTLDLFAFGKDSTDQKVHMFDRWVNTLEENNLYSFESQHTSEQKEKVYITRSTGEKFFLLNFSSYNYLGYGYHSEVKQAAKDAIDEYGTGAASSPIISGNFSINKILEKKLIDFMRLDNSYGVSLFSTGYGVNTGTISAYMEYGTYVIVDELVHTSIWEGARLSKAKILIFKHNDMRDLKKILNSIKNKNVRKLICCEGVYSADGDKANLKDIVKLAKKYHAKTLVDEAHSIMVAGQNGRGVSEELGILEQVDFFILTFSKAFCALGGALIAKKELTRYVDWFAKNRMFSAGIPPSVVGGIIKALDLGSSLDGQEKRIKIMDNAKLMMSLLKDKINILDSESWIIPIMYYDEKITLKLSDFLQRNGMDAGMMSYPSVPHNQARIRLFVTSEHTKEQIREGSIILIKAAKAFNFLK